MVDYSVLNLTRNPFRSAGIPPKEDKDILRLGFFVDPDRESAYDAVEEFFKGVERGDSPENIFLYGTYGTGKTHLLKYLRAEHENSHLVLYVSITETTTALDILRDIFTHLSDSLTELAHGKDREEIQRKIAELQSKKLASIPDVTSKLSKIRALAEQIENADPSTAANLRLQIDELHQGLGLGSVDQIVEDLSDLFLFANKKFGKQPVMLLDEVESVVVTKDPNLIGTFIAALRHLCDREVKFILAGSVETEKTLLYGPLERRLHRCLLPAVTRDGILRLIKDEIKAARLRKLDDELLPFTEESVEALYNFVVQHEPFQLGKRGAYGLIQQACHDLIDDGATRAVNIFDFGFVATSLSGYLIHVSDFRKIGAWAEAAYALLCFKGDWRKNDLLFAARKASRNNVSVDDFERLFVNRLKGMQDIHFTINPDSIILAQTDKSNVLDARTVVSKGTLEEEKAKNRFIEIYLERKNLKPPNKEKAVSQSLVEILSLRKTDCELENECLVFRDGAREKRILVRVVEDNITRKAIDEIIASLEKQECDLVVIVALCPFDISYETSASEFLSAGFVPRQLRTLTIASTKKKVSLYPRDPDTPRNPEHETTINTALRILPEVRNRIDNTKDNGERDMLLTQFQRFLNIIRQDLRPEETGNFLDSSIKDRAILLQILKNAIFKLDPEEQGLIQFVYSSAKWEEIKIEMKRMREVARHLESLGLLRTSNEKMRLNRENWQSRCSRLVQTIGTGMHTASDLCSAFSITPETATFWMDLLCQMFPDNVRKTTKGYQVLSGDPVQRLKETVTNLKQQQLRLEKAMCLWGMASSSRELSGLRLFKNVDEESYGDREDAKKLAHDIAEVLEEIRREPQASHAPSLIQKIDNLGAVEELILRLERITWGEKDSLLGVLSGELETNQIYCEYFDDLKTDIIDKLVTHVSDFPHFILTALSQFAAELKTCRENKNLGKFDYQYHQNNLQKIQRPETSQEEIKSIFAQLSSYAHAVEICVHNYISAKEECQSWAQWMYTKLVAVDVAQITDHSVRSTLEAAKASIRNSPFMTIPFRQPITKLEDIIDLEKSVKDAVPGLAKQIVMNRNSLVEMILVSVREYGDLPGLKRMQKRLGEMKPGGDVDSLSEMLNEIAILRSEYNAELEKLRTDKLQRISPKSRKLYEFVRAQEGVSLESIRSQFGEKMGNDQIDACIAELTRTGLIKPFYKVI